MTKFLKQLIILLVLGAAIYWAGKGIFIHKVFSTHDGLHHIARSFDAVAAIKEGHFPLRWAGSLNYWCGVPIFDLFYPLIYYLVVAINVFTTDIFKALNLVYFGSLALGTVSFYLWIKEETGKDLAALGGALVYLYAPYRFSLIFVRGSPEFLAYAILPFVLWLYARLFNARGKKLVVYSFLSALAGGLLAISHNFTVMFVMPIILLYLLVKILTLKPAVTKILLIAFTYLSAFGFGSFFIGPALMEKQYTRIGENSFFWMEHFPTLGQLIRSPWGYFYSSLGTHNDGMSFMLGYAQWVILGLGLLFILYELANHRLKISSFIKDNIWVLFFLVGSIASIYLILSWSIPVWEKIKLLQEIQFSWRLLGIAIFTLASLLAFMLARLKPKIVYIGLFTAVVALAFIGNRNHLLPQPVSSKDIYRFDDFEHLHPHRYSTTTFGDDVIAKTAPTACYFTSQTVSAQDGEDLEQEVVERGNTFGTIKFRTTPKTFMKDKLTLALGYFPGIYKFHLNGQPVDYADCEGLVCLDASRLRDGENIVSWKVGQSFIENAFNYVTLFFFVLWMLILAVSFIGIKYFKQKPYMPLLFVLAFLLFAFFRFYRIEDRIGWGWDQERDAWTVKEILSGNLTFIGPRVLGPGGFFLPPYFFYLLAPFYALTSLHPAATIYFLVFYALVFFGVWFVLVKRMFNPLTAVFSLLLWAVHPLTIQSDSIAWNPVVIPLISIVFLYALFSYFKTKNLVYLGLSALLFSFGVSFHFQFIMFAPVFIPVLLALKSKPEKIAKGILWLAAGVIIPFVPLLIFDLKNNFLNFNQLFTFSSQSGGGPTLQFLPVWERVGILLSGISGGATFGLLVHVLIGLAFFGVLSFFKKDPVMRSLWFGLCLVWLMSPILFSFFNARPSEYYFNFLLPLVALLFGYISHLLLMKSNYRLRFAGILALFTIITLFAAKSFLGIKKADFGLKEKERAVLFFKSANNTLRPMYIAFNVPYNEDAGYRYLISYYGIDYPGDPQSPMVEFLVPPSIRQNPFKVGNIGIDFPKDWLKSYWLNSE